MSKAHKQGNKEVKKPKQAPKPVEAAAKPAVASVAPPAPARKR